MEIRADLFTIYSLRDDEKPDGIKVESTSGATKAFNLNLNVTIDLAKIAAEVAASWILVRAIPCIRRGKDVYVNGKRLPPDERSARNVIMDAIDGEEKEKASEE